MSYRYANLPIEQVRPNAKNTRTHSNKQIRQIATSIRELGFAAPVLVDEYDVLIAGQALARDLTLVTANTREFLRVQGLRVENWEA